MQLRLTESGWGGTTRLTVLSALAFFIVSSLRRKLRCVSGIASELSARRFGDSRLTNLSHGLSADGIAPTSDTRTRRRDGRDGEGSKAAVKRNFTRSWFLSGAALSPSLSVHCFTPPRVVNA